MSITKGEMEDDLLSKGSVHSNKDNHANDNPDNILADSLYVVHNFDDDNYVATEQLSCDGEKGKADGLSFTSISNDNRDLDPNAESSFFIHTDNYGDINQIEDKEKKKKGVVLTHFCPIFPFYSPWFFGVFKGYKMKTLARNKFSDFCKDVLCFYSFGFLVRKFIGKK